MTSFPGRNAGDSAVVSPSRTSATRLPLIVHLATLVGALLVLVYLGRSQWFFFDEWDIIWPPEGARRLVEGHNGHWSLVPIAVWSGLQHVFGLKSYLPFISVAIAAHLAVAHLTWRISIRVGVNAWIATALVTVLLVYGAGSENLLWAFQMGFMGAIAFGLGAVLVAMSPRLSPLKIVSIAVLLLLGAATSGTSLPFFAATALILLVRHGWRRALLALVVPVVTYLVWYVFIAGPNPTAQFRASSPEAALFGIPAFVAQMWIGTYNASVPVPGFGIVVITAIVIWAVATLGRRAQVRASIGCYALLLAGLVFSTLTGYSRLALGVQSASESRYIYVIAVCALPTIGVMLGLLARRSVARVVAVVALTAVAAIYNLGLLFDAARNWNARESNSHQIISAALDLAERHPDAVDEDAKPEPTYVPRSLAELRELSDVFGLTKIPFTESARLTALTNVGLDVSPASSEQACTDTVTPGATLAVGPGKQVLVVASAPSASLGVAGVSGDTVGTERSLTVDTAEYLSAAEPVTLKVTSASHVLVCEVSAR